MAAPHRDKSWEALWQSASTLAEAARTLRRLSGEEPLLGARPDFPRARIGVSHADELHAVLDGLLRTLDEAQRLLPEALAGALPGGALPEEGGPTGDGAPRLAERLAALSTTAARLKVQAFQPPPPLPQHAPPYLGDAPRALPGSTALLLSYGLEEIVSALRNALLAAVNRDSS